MQEDARSCAKTGMIVVERILTGGGTIPTKVTMSTFLLAGPAASRGTLVVAGDARRRVVKWSEDRRLARLRRSPGTHSLRNNSAALVLVPALEWSGRGQVP